MANYVRVGGVWREINEYYVKAGGIWLSSANVWIKQDNTWKQSIPYIPTPPPPPPPTPPGPTPPGPPPPPPPPTPACLNTYSFTFYDGGCNYAIYNCNGDLVGSTRVTSCGSPGTDSTGATIPGCSNNCVAPPPPPPTPPPPPPPPTASTQWYGRGCCANGSTVSAFSSSSLQVVQDSLETQCLNQGSTLSVSDYSQSGYPNVSCGGGGTPPPPPPPPTPPPPPPPPPPTQNCQISCTNTTQSDSNCNSGTAWGQVCCFPSGCPGGCQGFQKLGCVPPPPPPPPPACSVGSSCSVSAGGGCRRFGTLNSSCSCTNLGPIIC